MTTFTNSDDEDQNLSPVHKVNNIVFNKQKLPIFKQNVALTISSNELFEIFRSISGKEKFQVIEMEQTIATAVNKEAFSLKKMMMKCLPF